MLSKSHFFYGKPILRHREQAYIEQLLAKYAKEPVDDELKKKVWEELQEEKRAGRIAIPFKVAIRRDSSGKFPDQLEIILDTKV